MPSLYIISQCPQRNHGRQGRHLPSPPLIIQMQKWGVFSMTVQRSWSLSPSKRNWLKEEATRFAVPECPLSWTGCVASKNSSGHFLSPFLLKTRTRDIYVPFTSNNTGRECPYYAHFTDEETEAEGVEMACYSLLLPNSFLSLLWSLLPLPPI